MTNTEGRSSKIYVYRCNSSHIYKYCNDHISDILLFFLKKKKADSLGLSNAGVNTCTRYDNFGKSTGSELIAGGTPAAYRACVKLIINFLYRVTVVGGPPLSLLRVNTRVSPEGAKTGIEGHVESYGGMARGKPFCEPVEGVELVLWVDQARLIKD